MAENTEPDSRLSEDRPPVFDVESRITVLESWKEAMQVEIVHRLSE